MRTAPLAYLASQCVKVELKYSRLTTGEARVNITTIGIDLAKTNFNLAGSDKRHRKILRKSLTRKNLLPFIAIHSLYLIGIEIRSGARFRARKIEKTSHQGRNTAIRFIEP